MKVEKFLKEANVAFEVHKHSKAYTAQELAHEAHVTGHAVAKSVVVDAGGQQVLCVLPASCRVDMGRLAEQLQVERCSLVDEATLEGLFPDVKVGAEPPFGSPYGLRTVVDRHLSECQTIVFCAGTYKKAIQMSYADYARVAEPEVFDFGLPPG